MSMIYEKGAIEQCVACCLGVELLSVGDQSR